MKLARNDDPGLPIDDAEANLEKLHSLVTAKETHCQV